MILHSEWEIDIVSDWVEIYSNTFQNQWQKYIDSAINPHVFFHPALCMAWIETYRSIRNLKPVFCTAKKDDMTVFLPLVLWRQNWKNVFRYMIVPVGIYDFDYHDPLVNRQMDQEDWHSYYYSMISLLKQKISFDKIEIDGIRVKMSGDYCVGDNNIAPYCDLKYFTDSKEFLQFIGFNLRRNIQKQIKRINNLGPISLFHHTNLDDALSSLNDFLQMHSLRWPNAYKAPLFHENLIRRGIKAGIVDFTSLKSGNKILSYHLGFIDSTRYYCYMIASYADYESLSPGKVHLFMLADYALQKGYQIIDFLKGAENYKSGWTNNFEHLYKYSYVNDRFTSKYKNFLIHLKKQF